MRLDLLADPATIHMNCEVAVVGDVHGGLRVLVRYPADPARRSDRGIRRCNRDPFACRQELLRRLPHRLKRVDKPQDHAVALKQRALALAERIFQGGERRRSLSNSTYYF